MMMVMVMMMMMMMVMMIMMMMMMMVIIISIAKCLTLIKLVRKNSAVTTFFQPNINMYVLSFA